VDGRHHEDDARLAETDPDAVGFPKSREKLRLDASVRPKSIQALYASD
jgi:hypothetical protein